MNAAKISVGDRLVLTADAEQRYGLTGSFEVVEIRRRNGYLTPWIYCEEGRLAFKPSDFAKRL